MGHEAPVLTERSPYSGLCHDHGVLKVSRPAPRPSGLTTCPLMHFQRAHLTQGPSAPRAHSEPTRAPAPSFARLHVSLGCACAGRTGKGNQGALTHGCSGEDSPGSVHRVLPLRTKRSINQGDRLGMAPVHRQQSLASAGLVRIFENPLTSTLPSNHWLGAQVSSLCERSLSACWKSGRRH